MTNPVKEILRELMREQHETAMKTLNFSIKGKEATKEFESHLDQALTRIKGLLPKKKEKDYDYPGYSSGFNKCLEDTIKALFGSGVWE